MKIMFKAAPGSLVCRNLNQYREPERKDFIKKVSSNCWLVTPCQLEVLVLVKWGGTNHVISAQATKRTMGYGGKKSTFYYF